MKYMMRNKIISKYINKYVILGRIKRYEEK